MIFENAVITGGAGFLGRAILQEAAHRWPLAVFTAYSRDPMKLQAVRDRFGAGTILGDVLDRDRLAVAFAGRSLVIHAAAMKHIPQGEQQPDECYRVNVEGSRNVIAAAIEAGVPHLVMISTDKVCDPANAYGLSKAMMERLATQAAQRQTRTSIHLVRYGNVVGSTGSVIPLFKRQALDCRPLTVTDPAMTRFWLSAGRAVAAIVRAVNGPSGATYVPRLQAMTMGELAGVFSVASTVIGIRPGEKLHETLMTADEAHRAITLDDGYQIYPPGSPASLANGGCRFSSEQADWIDPDDMRGWIAEGEMV